MNNLFKVEVGGTLTNDEVDVPIKTEELPGAVQKVEPEKVVEKKEELKKEEGKEGVVDLTKPVLPKIEVLTPDEVEEVPEELKEKKTVEKKEAVKPEDVLSLKNLAQYYIDEGTWEKWPNWDENKDTIEWTEETFANLSKEQIEYKIHKGLEEEKSALPERVKEITEYIKNGGNEQDLYGSYQEEINIDALDPKDADQAVEILTAHLQASGMNEKRIQPFIDSLKDQGADALKEAAEESKKALLESVQEERAGVVEEQKKVAEQNRIYWDSFNKKVRTSVFKDERSDRERKNTEKFIFDYKYEDKNTGQKYSEFGKKFEEIKNDPEKYYKFLRFIEDFDNFEEKSKTVKVENKKFLNLLRDSQQNLGGNKSSESPELQRSKVQRGQYNPFAKLGG